ncbi:hypothetical protein Tco_0152638 [Tanacetum coccineum]
MNRMRSEWLSDHPVIVLLVFYMAQQVILAAQLVPRFHKIGRCNNYVVLQSIPCSHKCKIVGAECPLESSSSVDALTTMMSSCWVGYQGVVDKNNPATDDITEGKKRKQIVGESSLPQKSLKIIKRQQKMAEIEKDDNDSVDRIEPGSDKDNPEHVDDDDDKMTRVDERKSHESQAKFEAKSEITRPKNRFGLRSSLDILKKLAVYLASAIHSPKLIPQ